MITAGCASVPVPHADIAVAQAAVQAADSPDTAKYAGAQLQLAVSKLEAARVAEQAKDNVSARRMAEEAQVDAQAAVAAASAARARKAAEDARDAARVLAEELARQAGR
ncbi:DUF4398 domain-containing protein [Roseateles amylovorans]|uniref:DUF4398 domain-containing protein n=1 Tax=Roseateles amylovorans TaxID=2978473 RepID=A0ABY6B3J0_9BURK|nr:DUF4398 domain-containing protein [Roseateles amylovorans]UXH79632.1 DUF4398 domain-containing protein [Roseateles amylovorans]